MNPAAIADVRTLTAPEERAIARSVLYASLFDYPLTLAQLRQTLIESSQTATEIVARCQGGAALHAIVECRDGFYFPRGRADLIDERRRREARSRVFLRHHRWFLACVAAMPYVRMVALSGSIAHLNLEGGGDLDLFIVTRGRRVWSVAVAVVVLAKLTRRRRIVCANYLVADTNLRIEQEDLFSASQIVHLKPLVGSTVYREFLAANPFVRHFYPNFHHADAGTLPFRPRWPGRLAKRIVEIAAAPVAPAIEAICRFVYRTYLARQSRGWRSPEQVRLQDDCVKLHTRSHRQTVLDRFDRAVRTAIDDPARV